MREHRCPACTAILVTPSVGFSFRCSNCRWYLITLAEWQALKPFEQGFVSYMQSSWPTSELAKVQNPYDERTPEHAAFCHGERRGVASAQDSEE